MTPGALHAGARVIARLDGTGATRLDEVSSCPPLALRFAAGALWMVGAAAGPLAGDRIALRIEVGPGASLTVRSTAASVALGRQGGAPSELQVEVDVAEGGELRWLPEQTVASAGCHHRSVARIGLATGARLVWRDELVLGRHGESPGRLTTRIEVEAGGRPLLRQEQRVGPDEPGWDGPAVVGRARALGIVVAAGHDYAGASSPKEASLGTEVAVMPLAEGAVLVSALGKDAPELRHRLEVALGSTGLHEGYLPADASVRRRAW